MEILYVLYLPPPRADPSRSCDAISIPPSQRVRIRVWRVPSCRAAMGGGTKVLLRLGRSLDASVFDTKIQRDSGRCDGIGCLHRRRIPTRNAVGCERRDG